MRGTLIAVCAALLSACDGYTYKGMDGRHALAHANTMPLPEAYSFYLDTYKGVHPPMLDVADTFRRFGDQGLSYLSRKAFQTPDRQEFEADLHALLILDYHCPERLTHALAMKGKRLGASISTKQACGSRS
jgi:hypothetical protein